MLQLMRFSVYFEKILYSSHGYFHIEVVISAARIFGGSGACSAEKFLKEWCPFLRFNVYFDQIWS